MEWGFGYGETEYEVSFGRAPQNGELSPSDSKTPEAFNYPFRARNPELSADSSSPQNLGQYVKTWVSRGIYNLPKNYSTTVENSETVPGKKLRRRTIAGHIQAQLRMGLLFFDCSGSGIHVLCFYLLFI